MKAIVLYSSKSGNTKKIADSIATQLGCEAVKVTHDTAPFSIKLENHDLIFVGTGLYAGTPNEDIVHYLKGLDLKNPKRFALFITWGGAPRSDKIALAKLSNSTKQTSDGVNGAFRQLWRLEGNPYEERSPQTRGNCSCCRVGKQDSH